MIIFITVHSQLQHNNNMYSTCENNNFAKRILLSRIFWLVVRTTHKGSSMRCGGTHCLNESLSKNRWNFIKSSYYAILHVVQHQSMQACNIAIGDFILEKKCILKEDMICLVVIAYSSGKLVFSSLGKLMWGFVYTKDL